jgi:hypothetical protein
MTIQSQSRYKNFLAVKIVAENPLCSRKIHSNFPPTVNQNKFTRKHRVIKKSRRNFHRLMSLVNEWAISRITHNRYLQCECDVRGKKRMEMKACTDAWANPTNFTPYHESDELVQNELCINCSSRLFWRK